MSEQPNISEYREADCTFQVNRETRMLKITGTPEMARLSVLKLRREGWLPKDLRAIWFSGDPAILICGVNLIIYLACRPEKPKVAPRSFKDLVQTAPQSQ